MTTFRAIASSLLALALCACGQVAAPAAQPEAATTSASDPAKPEASVGPASSALTPAMLVGRWGDNGDCTKDITFNADGSFLSYTGGSGTWTLNGDVMSMTGAGGTFQVRVSIINQNTLMIANPDGSIGTSQRC